MSRRRAVALRVRERRATIEQALLNRALRREKSAVDRVITRLVLTRIPEVADDQTGGGPRQRGRLDAPPRR